MTWVQTPLSAGVPFHWVIPCYTGPLPAQLPLQQFVDGGGRSFQSARADLYRCAMYFGDGVYLGWEWGAGDGGCLLSRDLWCRKDTVFREG